MGMLEELGTYLVGATGIGTLGTDVFLHTMPETSRATLSLFEAPGLGPQYAYGGTAPTFHRAQVDLVARSTAAPNGAVNPTATRTRLARAWNRLTAVTNSTLSGRGYLRVEPTDEPHLIDRDEQGRYVFGCSFTVMRRGSTAL